jgi:histone acetyltransferase (RNA polymerase elongator complex component)
MKKHAIIPIFIPHKGCPNDCVFCNQRKITARTEDVTPRDARNIIDTWLTTLDQCETVEAAFYGGSFTGLEIEEQSAYLAVTYEYKQKGLIDKIHLSTRPDYIDRSILDNLKKYSVDTIELGVQSFDDEVLRLSNRGHSSEDVYRAVDLIKEYGFEFGIQLMIGLPGDSLESCIMSARKTAELKPALARLYPTIVLDDTRLYEMYESGEYQALSREEAVLRTKEMYKILDDAGIFIMRVGLKSTDIIGEGGAINGGTYHPAFRQLVEGEIAKERIEPLLAESPELADHAAKVGLSKQSRVTVSSNSRWYSNMIGHKACNRRYFEEAYPDYSFKWTVDDSLSDGCFAVSFRESYK